MSVVTTEFVIPFEVTTGFKKKVANALNIGFSDLPDTDDDFIRQVVLPNLKIDFIIVDTITSEDISISDYISDQIPEEYIAPAQEDSPSIPVLLSTEPLTLEVVQDSE